MNIRDRIGDLLSYDRCDNCNHTMHGHENNSHILYQNNAIVRHCNRCPPPEGVGRLYKVAQNSMTPVNEGAYKFEVARAGQKGALYTTPEEVRRAAKNPNLMS